MANLATEQVLSVHHWTDTLFSFTTTRDPSFRFKNGHFTMIGLQSPQGRPLLRAYSIVSANYEDQLTLFLDQAERCDMDFWFGGFDSVQWRHDGDIVRRLPEFAFRRR